MQPVIPFKECAESMQLHRTFCEVGPLSSCVVWCGLMWFDVVCVGGVVL